MKDSDDKRPKVNGERAEMRRSNVLKIEAARWRESQPEAARHDPLHRDAAAETAAAAVDQAAQVLNSDPAFAWAVLKRLAIASIWTDLSVDAHPVWVRSFLDGNRMQVFTINVYASLAPEEASCPWRVVVQDSCGVAHDASAGVAAERHYTAWEAKVAADLWLLKDDIALP